MRFFEEMRNELEQTYASQWILIADGQFLGAAERPEELNHLAPQAKHRLIMQMGEERPQDVELGWQMTFA